LGRGRRVCAAGEGAPILLDPRMDCGVNPLTDILPDSTSD
jgi:hypothetical protein